MKIFLDTNILFSAILFPGRTPDIALQKSLTAPCQAITCDYVIEELIRKFSKKFPAKINALNAFVATLPLTITIVKVSDIEKGEEVLIRDCKDRPVLRAAIECGADILISGDKDFLESDIKHPKIMTAADFLSIDVYKTN